MGYARAAPNESNLPQQRTALKAAGAERIYEDKDVAGSAVIKPAYREMLRTAKRGDEIIVWRLDRLAYSLPALLDELQAIDDLGIEFRSLSERIDTVGDVERAFSRSVDAFVQFSKDVRIQRLSSEAADACREVRKPGRPSAVSDEQWSTVLALMVADPPLSVSAAGEMLGISRQAVHKRLKAEAAKRSPHSQRKLPHND